MDNILIERLWRNGSNRKVASRGFCHPKHQAEFAVTEPQDCTNARDYLKEQECES